MESNSLDFKIDIRPKPITEHIEPDVDLSVDKYDAVYANQQEEEIEAPSVYKYVSLERSSHLGVRYHISKQSIVLFCCRFSNCYSRDFVYCPLITNICLSSRICARIDTIPFNEEFDRLEVGWIAMVDRNKKL